VEIGVFGRNRASGAAFGEIYESLTTEDTEDSLAFLSVLRVSAVMVPPN